MARLQATEPVYLPRIAHRAPLGARPQLRVVAFLPDGQAAGDTDELIVVQNVGTIPTYLSGWKLSDGEGVVQFPGHWLEPGNRYTCARTAAGYRQEWGRTPDCEYAQDTDPDVPNARGRAPNLANSGDEIYLLDSGGTVRDAVLYGESQAETADWQGAPLQYYDRSTGFAREGQLFYRLFDPISGMPLADSDTAADWAQGLDDPARGRRAAYPGWDIYEFSQPAYVSWVTPHTATLFVAPDNILAGVIDLLAAAQESIYLEIYELEHPDVVRVLAQRAAAGVKVQILLEGGPTGGITDLERWAAQQVVGAGGDVRFMVNDIPGAHDRYPYQHAKFAIIDGRTLWVSTENATYAGMPILSSAGTAAGHRGYAVIVQDPILVARAQEIFARDADPARNDIFPWTADHPTYGAPPAGYSPPDYTPGLAYGVRYPVPVAIADASAAYLFTSPESSLTPGPLLALLGRADAGDTILVEQLFEHAYWGRGDSDPLSDPNPRLEALIAAARRGARVRLLLDSYYDDPFQARNNVATLNYVTQVAAREGLDLEARRANPAGQGIHAKLHLVSLGQERWVVVGSMNGGEVSNKLNREMALALETGQGYEALAQVFWWDWSRGVPAGAVATRPAP